MTDEHWITALAKRDPEAVKHIPWKSIHDADPFWQTLGFGQDDPPSVSECPHWLVLALPVIVVLFMAAIWLAGRP